MYGAAGLQDTVDTDEQVLEGERCDLRAALCTGNGGLEDVVGMQDRWRVLYGAVRMPNLAQIALGV